ncbi:MAG: PAS domain S-box protein [Proteobacteria bacterium]|nr:PAS domain S-box protein [Pseudomonadota bacterium]
MADNTDKLAPKILIVDDEVLIAEDLASRIEGLGYTICGQAPSAEKAFELLEKQQPDLVMMDIVIKGEMDGIEAAEVIRDKWGIPVVFLTAYADSDRLERAKLTYPFGYILKPFQDRDIKITVEMALYAARADGERRAAAKSLRRSNNFLHTVVEQSPFPMWISDEKGTLININQACRDLLQISAEEVVGKYNIFEDTIVIDQGLIPTVRKAYEEGVKVNFHIDWYAGDISNVELKNRVRVMLDVTISPIKEEDGQVTNAIIQHIDVTRQRMTEEALRESESRLVQAQHIAHIGNWEWNILTNQAFWSDEIFRIYGFKPQEISPDFDLVINAMHPDSINEFRAAIDASLNEDRPFELDYQFFRKDGTVAVVHAIGHVFLDAEGKAFKMVGIVQDITDPKQAEEALRESEERHRTILRTAIDGFWMADMQGRFLEVNEAYCRMSGYSEQELLGMSISDIEYIDTSADTAGYMQRIVAQGEDRFETRHRHKDGNIFDVEVSVKYLPGQGGRSVAFLRDITGRKRAEKEQREKQELFRDVFEQAAVGMSILSPSGVWLQVNQRLSHILGYSEEELLDINFRDITPAESVDNDVERVRQMVAGIRNADSWEKRYIRKDGQVIWVRITTALTRDQDGRPKYFLTVTEDINELKETEKDKAVLQLQLQQAHKIEAIGTLAGGIAHDFNNLLQAINGYTQLLLMDKAEQDPEYPSLMAIQNAGTRASNLVRQLLLFSRKAEIVRRPVDLNLEIEQARRILERTIPKMVDIEVHPGGRLWPVLADPVQVEQILLNLGTNAADAMPDGGKLVIETADIILDDDYAQRHLDAQPGRYVLITVSDTGHGMDQETMEKIFDPFFTTKEFGQGTGLGLASVYGIVKNHGGNILCYSEVGQGTSFKIYMPAMEQPETLGENDEAPQPIQSGTETILFVDDEAPIRDFGFNALHHFGYQVMTATNGQEALQIYTEKKDGIDLVILDIGMPVMGGHQCLVELRKVNPSVRVLIASGYSINGHARKVMDSGAMGFISKPYQINELLSRVRSALDEKK